MMLSNLNLSSLPECNFEVRYVDSVLLNPCAEYQRLLRMGKVTKIAANFSEYIANEPKVSYRDGRYFVFDGQNTIEARKTCNDGRDLPIRCKVFYGLSKEHEALLFAVQTGISSELTAGEQLRAKLVAHEENACDFCFGNGGHRRSVCTGWDSRSMENLLHPFGLLHLQELRHSPLP